MGPSNCDRAPAICGTLCGQLDQVLTISESGEKGGPTIYIVSPHNIAYETTLTSSPTIPTKHNHITTRYSCINLPLPATSEFAIVDLAIRYGSNRARSKTCRHLHSLTTPPSHQQSHKHLPISSATTKKSSTCLAGSSFTPAVVPYMPA